jgi:muramoyltetrapeptide carboxypeptidase
VIAPSSPFEAVVGWRGLGWLSERYRVRFDRGLFTRTGYLAGDDARRREELERALSDPGVKCIVAARGGYGASRFIHTVAWSALAASPRWIVGFSDVTALHVEAARAGVASIHGAHLTALGRGDHRARAAFTDVVEAPLRARSFSHLGTLVSGLASGPLFGGNLTLLHACAAAGRLLMPRGCVLFLEDVTERPYRVDRMLTTLAIGGHFDHVSGVVLGDFTQCDPGSDGVTIETVLAERLGALGVPVACGLPAGHGGRNEPLVFGARATLDASAGGATLVVGG